MQLSYESSKKSDDKSRLLAEAEPVTEKIRTRAE
jgi:hypothetical protein